MVAFNFTLFTDLVTDGIKRQTIRAEEGKMGLRASSGATLQLYTGQRTKKCHKLRPDVICEEAIPFKRGGYGSVYSLSREGLKINLPELALLDGFQSVGDMAAFFPSEFEGWLYWWEVSRTSLSIRHWWYVWRDPVPDSLYFGVPSGRRYWVRFAKADYLPGACGLMRGIPADWRLT